MPAIFADNLVLQQQRPIPVWGWAAPGKMVTVNFAVQTKTVRVGSDGKWQVKISRLEASSKPEALEIASAVT